MLQLFLSAYWKDQEKITWTGVLKNDFSCFLVMRQYFNKNHRYYLEKKTKKLFDKLLPCSMAKPIPIVGFTLILSYFYHLLFQWANSETLIRRRAMESSSASDQTLHWGYVLKYDAIGYVRSYRDGHRIFQNSLVFIIFCYSFDNRYILSFLGNHYSLTFQFWLFINGNQHQTRICRSQNLLWSLFLCNG